MRPKLMMQANSESVALGNSKRQAVTQTTAADNAHPSLEGQTSDSGEGTVRR